MFEINVDLENVFHLLVDIILIKVKDLSHLSIYFLLKILNALPFLNALIYYFVAWFFFVFPRI